MGENKRIAGCAIENAVIGIAYCLLGISYFVSSLLIIAQMCLILVIAYCAIKGNSHKLAPVFIFFNSSLLYIFGVAIVDLFFVSYLVGFFIRKKNIEKQISHGVLFMFIMYSGLVISTYNVMLSIEIILSLLVLILLLDDLRSNVKWIEFCQWYIVGLLVATIYGVGIYITEVSNSESYETVRYISTFVDPNYAGMFISIGLYMVLIHKSVFPLIYRYFALAVCVVSICMTLSSSAIICNIVIVMVLIVTQQRTIKEVKASRIYQLVLTSVFTYFFITQIMFRFFPDTFRMLERFWEKFLQLDNGDLVAATTGRSELWEKHLSFFLEQDNALRILFGGHYITDRGSNYNLFAGVSHQVYVDALLCFGIVGTALYVVTILSVLKKKWSMRNCSETNRVQLIITLIWLVYSLILSMFPSWIFAMMLFVDTKTRD